MAAPPLRVALVSSEVAPFAKTGGLADVVAALARALHRAGHDVRVFLPCYATMRKGTGVISADPLLQDLRLEFPGESYRYGVRTAPLPGSADEKGEPLRVEFIDCPELYHRGGFYTGDADEPVRWVALCRAMVEVLQRTGWAPDIVHCNDWHAGLLPLLLRTWYGWDELFAGTRTLLSIHNIGYQGNYPAELIDRLGLSEARDQFHQEHLSDGYIGFMETGILYAHWLSTVSETYASEIQTEELGMGLHSLLQARADHLAGIVNGVDYAEWSPDVDERIPANYDAEDLSGKADCKRALLERMGVVHDPGALTIGIVSRFSGQKGLELLPDALSVLLRRDEVRLVVLGSGEERSEHYFRWLRDAIPGKVGVHIGYDDELAHWVEAGSDLFLMPSRYEPCGLNQMYSLRYGTVPLVRHTGGLADTVQRWDPEARSGTGFVFYEFSSEALLDTLAHALDVWRDREAWTTLVRNGMAQDFSWERQARKYVDLYRHMLAE
jgi:starch synthase